MEIIYFHALLSAIALVFSEGYEVPEESVMEELFYEYNNEARPASVRQPVVKVSHQLTLTRIISLREELLVIDTWQVISWKDPRLVWDRSYYDDVETINVDPSKIWKPDIVNFHNAGGNSGLIYENLPLTVKYNGEIVYVPPTRLTTQCQPYGDVYHCIWTFGSWTHDIKKLDINNTHGAIDMSEYEENSRIAIIDSSVKRTLKKYAYFPNRYAILTYNITIRWKDADRFDGLEPLRMPSDVSKKSELQNDEHIPVEETVSESTLVNATDASDSEKEEGESEGDAPTEEEKSTLDDNPADYWDGEHTDSDYTDSSQDNGNSDSTQNENAADSSENKENAESSQGEDGLETIQDKGIAESTPKMDATDSSQKEEIVESAQNENITEPIQNEEIFESVQNGNTTEPIQNGDAATRQKNPEDADQTAQEGNGEVEAQESEPDSGEDDTAIGAWQRIKSIWSK